VATDPANALLAVGLSSGVAVAAALARSVPSAAAPAAHRNGTRADEGSADEDDDEEDARSAKSTEPWLQRLPWLRRGGGGRGRRRRSSWRRRIWGGGCCWCGGCCRPAAVVCFVAALLTHVELLRYLHLVVVPGEQRLCAVW
jgi:hypothetical protein